MRWCSSAPRNSVRPMQELKIAKEKAEEARRRIVEITDNVPCVVFEFEKMRDGTARAPFVSGGMEALIGVSAAEVMKDVRRYFATVLPEDVEALCCRHRPLGDHSQRSSLHGSHPPRGKRGDSLVVCRCPSATCRCRGQCALARVPPRHYRSEEAGRGVAGCQGGCGRSDGDEVDFPGQHEPRDPDSDECGDRHGVSGLEDAAEREAAGLRQQDSQCGDVAAGGDQ